MNEIILMSDPRVGAVQVQECGEPLVDIRQYKQLLVDLRKQCDSDGYFYLRPGLADRLAHAEAELPDGMRFLVVEGYRPPALQRRYFAEYMNQLRSHQPDWTEERLRSATSRFVSPPEIAPHSAGAAVDLTLVDKKGNELDLGTPMNATPEESSGACYTDAFNIDGEARALRGVLKSVLVAAGLVNYPTEWWHWSYGDRYWALATGAENAVYGPLEGLH
ncbi:M15 family metallopeptidase [Streptomyces sp. MMBL 11-3]|uniref:M15 family metallopeptidase n=1 Tax=Streptomyces sp. MMBL 11-3 TaxID=3382639 RepID=UPI0039B3E576